MMRIYLASRYSRRAELVEYRKQLERAGHVVTSRWLDGAHQISDEGVPLGDDGEALVDGGVQSERAAILRQHFAKEDLAGIWVADVFIAFTEPPRSDASRGGRHVELGFAIAYEMPIIVVGYRENVFCWLPTIQFAEDWDQAVELLGSIVYEANV